MAERLESDGHEDRVGTVARIRQCLDGDQLRMLYQPIVDLDTGRFVGFEALARFDADSDRPPDAWLADAHAVGLGVALEVKAVVAALAVLDQIPEEAYLSVNVGAETLCSNALEAVLAGVSGHRLVLELTEHDEVRDPAQVGVVLDRYRARGIRLAVDDLGAGYAGLVQLMDLAPDMIKMDRALTRHIDVDPVRRSLGQATAAFGASVGATVIAEGVESEAELEALRDLGMAAAQGYFLGRPTEAPWERVEPTQRLIWPERSPLGFKLSRDAFIVSFVALYAFVLSSTFDVSERIASLDGRFEVWQVDEIPVALSVVSVALVTMGLLRGRLLLREVARRREAEHQLGRANADLWRRRLSEARAGPCPDPGEMASLGGLRLKAGSNCDQGPTSTAGGDGTSQPMRSPKPTT